MMNKDSQRTKPLLDTKPDVIFIGFAKAGSSYLQTYLDLHPGIQLKWEATYFQIDERFNAPGCVYVEESAPHSEELCVIDTDESLAWGGILSEGEKVTPEILAEMPYTALSTRPWHCDPSETARRIKQTVPDTKILIVIRNQVDWFRSSYLNFVDALTPKNRTFQGFLNTRIGKALLYSGCFNRCIETYFEAFGRDNVRVMLTEELGNGREEPLRELCQFLGVSYVAYPLKHLDFNRGPGNAHGYMLKLASAWGGPHGPILKWKRLYYRGPIKAAIRRLMARDPLSSQDKAFIRATYAASNYLTGNLLGKDLSQYGYPL